METGLVSIVMSVFNGEKFLSETMDSLLSQTYDNIELIVLNNGSTDRTIDILNEYKTRDNRIQIIENKQNLGVSLSRNIGLDIARGEFIAVADADDLYLPERIEKQLQFMRANEDVVICGANSRSFGSSNQRSVFLECDSDKIEGNLIFDNPLIHPSVFIRSSALKDNDIRYSSKFIYAHDYDIYVRLWQVGKLANLDDVLINYRVHSKSVSRSKNPAVLRDPISIKVRLLNLLKLTFTEEDIDIHNHIGKKELFREFYIKEIEVWCKKLIDANESQKVFNNEAFKFMLIKNLIKSFFKSDITRYYSVAKLIYGNRLAANISFLSKLRMSINIGYKLVQIKTSRFYPKKSF